MRNRTRNKGTLLAWIIAEIPTLWNDGGYLALTFSTGWPSTEPLGPVGALWSNGGFVSVAGITIPNPSAPPVFYGSIDAADLLVLGGANLPITPPEYGSLQLWNNGGLVLIA